MATKMSNVHLNTLLEMSNAHRILDTYITLCHVSSEINNKFLISTIDESKTNLINVVKKYVSSTYRTINNNINELINLNILKYNAELSAWHMVDMEKMVQTKLNESEKNKLGFVRIRDFFLTQTFQNMKFAEKRVIIFLAKLADSKNSKNYNDFIMNLNKKNSNWFKIFRTKSKYYARKIMNELLIDHKDLLFDKSNELRDTDLSPDPIKRFKFSFKCEQMSKLKTDNSDYDLIKKLNPKEFELVKERIKFANITLSKTKIMHLVRAISNIKEWTLKERIVTIIINKYIAIQNHKSREDIKSLPAYLVAVTKTVIEEYKELILNIPTTLQDKFEDNDDFAYDSLSSVLDMI